MLDDLNMRGPRIRWPPRICPSDEDVPVLPVGRQRCAAAQEPASSELRGASMPCELRRSLLFPPDTLSWPAARLGNRAGRMWPGADHRPCIPAASPRRSPRDRPLGLGHGCCGRTARRGPARRRSCNSPPARVPPGGCFFSSGGVGLGGGGAAHRGGSLPVAARGSARSAAGDRRRRRRANLLGNPTRS